MTRRRKITIAAAALGLLLIVLGLFLMFHRPAGPSSEFDAITDGMTPQQVRALLGTEAVVASEDGDSRTEIYHMSKMGMSWGQIHVGYRRGRVTDKGFVSPPSLADRLWDWVDDLQNPPPTPVVVPPARPKLSE
jgi:hypothetical protein